jgi:hypothetical protein
MIFYLNEAADFSAALFMRKKQKTTSPIERVKKATRSIKVLWIFADNAYRLAKLLRLLYKFIEKL